MTFSIAARCAQTGQFGIAIASSSPAVAARCAHARAGIGAVCSQNVTDPRLGPAALDLLALGAPADAAVAILVGSRRHMAHRQLVVVDAQGRTAIHTGSNALGLHAHAEGRDAAAAGNLLGDESVPAAMVAAFEASAPLQASSGTLAERLVGALQAGLAAGGEAGPVHSAGLLVVAAVPWPIADLRVDWDDTDPVGRLADLWRLYAPQLEAYVTRGLDPTRAPRYGVPGDT